MSVRVPVLPHVEITVGQPKTVLHLDVDVPLAFQKCNCADPVSLLHVVLQCRHLLLLHLTAIALLTRWPYVLVFRDRCPWTIHFKFILILSCIGSYYGGRDYRSSPQVLTETLHPIIPLVHVQTILTARSWTGIRAVRREGLLLSLGVTPRMLSASVRLF